jgi:hypothetical protein
MLRKSVLFIALAAFVFTTSQFAFAADPTPTNPILAQPDWVIGLLAWVETLPKVGPFLLVVFHWVGAISAVFTALSIFAQTVLAIPEVVARFSGAPKLADDIKSWSDKIVFWLKFFSIRNAK